MTTNFKRDRLRRAELALGKHKYGRSSNFFEIRRRGPESSANIVLPVADANDFYNTRVTS